MKGPERTFLTLERKTSANCMIYALLKKDQETLSKLSLGMKPPEPVLYDPEVHRRHRESHYRAPASKEERHVLVRLPSH